MARKKNDLGLCTLKNPENCSDAQIKMNIVMNTTYTIILSAFITVFSLLLSNLLLNLFLTYFSSIIATIFLSIGMLVLIVFLSMRNDRRVKKWMLVAEQRKVSILE